MPSMLKNGRSNATHGLAFDGCSCCNSTVSRRRARKSAKAKEKKAVTRDIRQERGFTC